MNKCGVNSRLFNFGCLWLVLFSNMQTEPVQLQGAWAQPIPPCWYLKSLVFNFKQSAFETRTLPIPSIPGQTLLQPLKWTEFQGRAQQISRRGNRTYFQLILNQILIVWPHCFTILLEGNSLGIRHTPIQIKSQNHLSKLNN